MKLRILPSLFVVIALFSFSACGGGGSSGSPPPASYTIGITVSGLTGNELALQDNGGDNLPITANGSYTFATHIAGGGTYNITVLTQPSNPSQLCVVPPRQRNRKRGCHGHRSSLHFHPEGVV